MFQAPTLPNISHDKNEWPALDESEDAFEAQFQSKENCIKAVKCIGFVCGCHQKSCKIYREWPYPWWHDMPEQGVTKI